MKEVAVLEQIREAKRVVKDLDLAVIKKFSKKFSNIVFSGIGKSGLIEKVVKDLGMEVPIETARANKAPDINSKSLGVVVSYTGLTNDILDFLSPN